METANLDQDRPIDILRIVALARQQRSKALGDLIATGGRKGLAYLAEKGDAFLHAFLMSPTTHRLAK